MIVLSAYYCHTYHKDWLYTFDTELCRIYTSLSSLTKLNWLTKKYKTRIIKRTPQKHYTEICTLIKKNLQETNCYIELFFNHTR